MKSRLLIEIRMGELLAQTDVQAIVNPTNDYLMLTGSLGHAIREGGGAAVETEAQSKGPIELGEATHTGAGTLPFRHVIHAAIIGLREQDLQRERQQGTLTSGRTISEATLNALDQAHILNLESVAMPPIGYIDCAFPLEQCSDIMLGEIQAFAAANPEATLQRVVIVCPDRKSFEVFNRKTTLTMAS